VSRLARFEAYRYVGVRDTMRFYDCDDEAQFDEISTRVSEEGLVGRNLIQVFAPDTPVEARNRGFRPAVSVDEVPI
jgi:hypothetical protein